MKTTDAKVLCQTPTPGKQPTQIPKWKYDLVRGALGKVVPKSRDGLAFREVPDMIADVLTAEERTRLGPVSWYATTVKLHLEVVGELERVAGAVPQRIRRTA